MQTPWGLSECCLWKGILLCHHQLVLHAWNSLIQKVYTALIDRVQHRWLWGSGHSYFFGMLQHCADWKSSADSQHLNQPGRLPFGSHGEAPLLRGLDCGTGGFEMSCLHRLELYASLETWLIGDLVPVDCADWHMSFSSLSGCPGAAGSSSRRLHTTAVHTDPSRDGVFFAKSIRNAEGQQSCRNEGGMKSQSAACVMGTLLLSESLAE